MKFKILYFLLAFNYFSFSQENKGNIVSDVSSEMILTTEIEIVKLEKSLKTLTINNLTFQNDENISKIKTSEIVELSELSYNAFDIEKVVNDSIPDEQYYITEFTIISKRPIRSTLLEFEKK